MTHYEQPEQLTGFDERTSRVITEKRFFESYRTELHDLFVALDREDRWSDNPRNMLSYMRSGWIGAEHGNSTEKDQFTPEQVAAATPILESMGFAKELLPEPGSVFDQTIVVGGTMTANYRRAKLVKGANEQGTDLGTEIWMVGQRPRESRDGSNEALLSADGVYEGHDVTQNPWLQAKLRQGVFEGDPSARDGWEFSETDTAILSLLKVVDPALRPGRIDLAVVDADDPNAMLPERRPDAPPRVITDYRYKTQDYGSYKGHEIILINAAAVERKTGDKVSPSRHTTRSSTSEWLKRHAPKHGAKVLYVTGNPHSVRTTQSTYDELKRLGRDDIELVVAGTAPSVDAPIQLYLGEVARLIDNDVKTNY